ncbi:MAG: ATP-binding protein [Candidatus Glassbacteria bacterium]
MSSLLRPSAGRARQEKLNYTLNEFSRSLTLIVDLEQLKDSVITYLREIVNVNPLYIYLLNIDLNRYQLVESRGYEMPEEENLFFDPDGPLVHWLAVNETHLVVSEHPDIFAFFSEAEREMLERTGVESIFPLMSMNRLTGLVCLGPKTSREKMAGDEIELLDSLMGRAALAFDNAYLYQQQKSRLKKMYRADRLATLGQLAAGAAHEIRNPLTSIRSTIQYLQKSLIGRKEAELVAELIEEVDRINGIIEGLLSFSKPTKPEMKRFDLEQLLSQTIALVDNTARKSGVAIELNYRVETSLLAADPALLKQVFLNLMMNSIEAMEDGGRLTISVDQAAKGRTDLSSRRHNYSLVFQDTGQGIPPADLEHVFDPFFTTKKDGTGLGLSICYGIIQQHGGEIEIESETAKDRPEKHGTRITLHLPAGN